MVPLNTEERWRKSSVDAFIQNALFDVITAPKTPLGIMVVDVPNFGRERVAAYLEGGLAHDLDLMTFSDVEGFTHYLWLSINNSVVSMTQDWNSGVYRILVHETRLKAAVYVIEQFVQPMQFSFHKSRLRV